jgi:adenylate kinase
MSPLNLILLGPPGAGKGTQASRLTEEFGLPHIATGDILRAAIAAGSELGQLAKQAVDAGELVPDEVIVGVVLERLLEPDAAGGFLLDGFPRTIGQADALASALAVHDRELSAALLIEVPDDVVVRRISGRRMSRSGRVYHVEFDPPKHADRCDLDGSQLVQRDDDREDIVRKRLAVYHEQTAPLIGYYEELGLLRRFDGTRPVDEVHALIRANLSVLALEERLR